MTRVDAVSALHRAETLLLEDVLTAAAGRETLEVVVDELREVRAFLESPTLVVPSRAEIMAAGAGVVERE